MLAAITSRHPYGEAWCAGQEHPADRDRDYPHQALSIDHDQRTFGTSTHHPRRLADRRFGCGDRDMANHRVLHSRDALSDSCPQYFLGQQPTNFASVHDNEVVNSVQTHRLRRVLQPLDWPNTFDMSAHDVLESHVPLDSCVPLGNLPGVAVAGQESERDRSPRRIRVHDARDQPIQSNRCYWRSRSRCSNGGTTRLRH